MYFAFFAHLSSVLVQKHQHVSPGPAGVALTGVSGLPLVRDSAFSHTVHPCSSHPHLHFEIRTSAAEHLPDGRHLRVDPQRFLGFIPYQQDTIDYLLYKSSIA